MLIFLLLWILFNNRITIKLTGKSSDLAVFQHESGGHRFQRIPPTERKGRVHTSTCTVALMPSLEPYQFQLNDTDIDIKTARGSGAGGQHRNKTDSCVVMTHKPTGLMARVDGRSQLRNRQLARALLESRVFDLENRKIKDNHQGNRKSQIGSGMRADKIRTYRYQDQVVIDHRSGKKKPLKKVLGGDIQF